MLKLEIKEATLCEDLGRRILTIVIVLEYQVDPRSASYRQCDAFCSQLSSLSSVCPRIFHSIGIPLASYAPALEARQIVITQNDPDDVTQSITVIMSMLRQNYNLALEIAEDMNLTDFARDAFGATSDD